MFRSEVFAYEGVLVLRSPRFFGAKFFYLDREHADGMLQAVDARKRYLVRAHYWLLKLRIFKHRFDHLHQIAHRFSLRLNRH